MKKIILFSFVLSILHSILFYGNEWGISVFLFILSLLFIVVNILQKKQIIKNKKALWLCIPIVLLSSTYFIFQQNFFYICNMTMIIVLFGIMIILAIKEETKVNQIIAKVLLLFLGPIDYCKKAVKLIKRSLFGEIKQNGGKKQSRKIIKAILYSIPLVIVVLILLSSADKIFSDTFSQLFQWGAEHINIINIMNSLFRVVIIVTLFIYFIAFFLNILNKDSYLNEKEEESEHHFQIQIESFTMNTLLTILNGIYAIFTITQSISLISQMTKGNIHYAEYARSGFFQLMFVSFINLALIFISQHNQKEMSKQSKSYMKRMNILLAVFTIVILISSVIRMYLYEQAYGYTFLRLMVYFIQITELILIIPTIVYIINKKFKIIIAYFIICITAYVIINFVNMDGIIARGNIQRYKESLTQHTQQELDLSYLQLNISIDAVPELISLLEIPTEEMPEKDRWMKRSVYNYLEKLGLELEQEERNFAEYNIAKERAERLIKELKPQGKGY